MQIFGHPYTTISLVREIQLITVGAQRRMPLIQPLLIFQQTTTLVRMVQKDTLQASFAEAILKAAAF